MPKDLKSGSSKPFESFFKVTMNTRTELEYLLKFVVQIRKDGLSAGIAVVKGQDDNFLTWPFHRRVVIRLDNEDETRSIDRTFSCDDRNANICKCLQKPVHDSNHPVGITDVILIKDLDCGFVRNNYLTIKALIMPMVFEQDPSELPTILI